MDNRRLIDGPGREPHTPLDDAIETTLAEVGCIGADAEDVLPADRRICAK